MQAACAEGLRRLRLPQTFARHGVHDAVIVVLLFERIGHRHGQNRAVRAVGQCVQQAVQHGNGQAAARRVVHQHDGVGR